jgi:hypothetical protein
VCDGFCVELDDPSPKLQLHETTGPVDWSVNCTLNGACPEVGLAEKPALTGCGGFVTVIVWLTLLVWPLLPATVKVTVKLPALLYVCDGFCAELAEPSPKSQLHAVTGPLD